MQSAAVVAVSVQAHVCAADVALDAATGPSVTVEASIATPGGLDVATASRNKPCRGTPSQLRCR
jgi:hypothetical protein